MSSGPTSRQTISFLCLTFFSSEISNVIIYPKTQQKRKNRTRGERLKTPWESHIITGLEELETLRGKKKTQNTHFCKSHETHHKIVRVGSTVKSMILWAGFMTKNPETLGCFFPQPSRHKGRFWPWEAGRLYPGAALSGTGVSLPLSSILVPRKNLPGAGLRAADPRRYHSGEKSPPKNTQHPGCWSLRRGDELIGTKRSLCARSGHLQPPQVPAIGGF